MRAIIAVMFVSLAAAETVLYPRGCIYIVGRCYKECPIGTHAYALGCGYKTPEPTCKELTPKTEEYMLCDYSACYCDPPTVRDEKTDKCVPVDQCSPQDPGQGVAVPAPTLLPPLDIEKPKDQEKKQENDKPKHQENTENAEKPTDQEKTKGAEIPKDQEKTEDGKKPKDQGKTEDSEKPKDQGKTEDDKKPKDQGKTEAQAKAEA